MKRFIFCEHNIALPSLWPHYRTIAAALPQDQITSRHVGSIDHEIPAGAVALFAESPTPVAIPRPFKLVHTFHGLAEKGYTYEACRNRIFDLILSPGPHATSILIANGIDPARISEIGMPKLDGVFTMPKHIRGNKPVVLYAPTGLNDWRSSLRRIGPQHLCSPDWELRFRMHPLDKNCRDCNLENRIGHGAVIDYETDPVKIFSDVDLLISDYSSIMIEFAMLDRPVLKLDTLGWLDNRNLIDDFEVVSSFTRSVAVPRSGMDVTGIISEMLAANPTPYPAEFERIIPRSSRDGRAGERAAEAILKLIEERKIMIVPESTESATPGMKTNHDL